VDLSVRTRTFGLEDRSWLASGHGTEAMTDIGGTLDLTLFPQATYWPQGYIKSGLVMGKVTASGLFGPYSASATDGRQIALGLLFNTIEISIGSSATRHGFPLLRHGAVHKAHPSWVGLDAAAQTALPLIIFV